MKVKVEMEIEVSDERVREILEDQDYDEEQIARFDENDLFDADTIFEYVSSDVENVMSEYFEVNNVKVKDHRTETRLVTSAITKTIYIAECVCIDKKKGQYASATDSYKKEVSVDYLLDVIKSVLK